MMRKSAKKKKVLIFYSGVLFGGIDTMLINLSPKFYDEFEVILAYANRENISSAIFSNKLDARRYKVPFKRWTFLFGIIYLIYIIWKEKIDILFTQEVVISIPCRIAKIIFPKLLHVTSICSNLRIFTNAYNNFSINAILFLNKRTQHLVDKYICVSHYLSNYLQVEGVNGEKIEVIYLGVSPLEEMPKKPSRGSIWIVAYVGRIAYEKGTDVFLAIADRYLKNSEDDAVEFHLIGGGEYCREEIAFLRIKYPHCFIAHGFVEDVHQIPMDCLIIPSRDDGLPYVVIEAFNKKIPVIASNRGALPELIMPNKTGIICDNNDVLSYINAVRKIKNDREFRNQLINNAYQAVLERYSNEKMQNSFISLFNTLCR